MLVWPGLQPAASRSADRRLSNRANPAAGKGKLALFSTKDNVLLTPNPSYFSAINFHPRPHLPYIDPKWTLTLPSTFFFPPPHLYCFPPPPPPRFFIVFLFHHHRHRISTVFPPPTQPPPHHKPEARFYCAPAGGLISTTTNADRFQITDRRCFRYFKGEALRILRTNSSKTAFEEYISNFKKRLTDRGYPQTIIENLPSDIKFTERESALVKHNNKEEKEILP